MPEVKSIPSPADGTNILDSVRSTVEHIPTADGSEPFSFVYHLASIADTVTAWGRDVQRRDEELRNLILEEPMLSGAIYSVVTANSAFRWEIACDNEKLRKAVTDLLNFAEYGKGWNNFISRIALDLLTQDNGAFIQMIRSSSRPDASLVGITTLDSQRCIRTGDPAVPVLYKKENGDLVKLKWYEVVDLVEFPCNIKKMRGIQYSGLTRVLRAAQIMRDIAIYRGEKVGGRFNRVLHIIGGPAKREIERAMEKDQENANNVGLTRYLMPTIITSLDPTSSVSHVEIPMASLPDNFSLEEEMKWYLTTLAMGFGRDYQDFAPLPGGNLGTSNQSEILDQKSRGKGPATFMQLISYAMNYRGIVPYPMATFSYRELDLQAEAERGKIGRTRAEMRKSMIESGEITPEAAREMAVAAGDYDHEIVALIERTEQERKAEMEAIREQESENKPPDGEENNPPTRKEAYGKRRPFGFFQSIFRKEMTIEEMIANEYDDRLVELVKRFMNGEITREQFIDQAMDLIGIYMVDAFLAGYEDSPASSPIGDDEAGLLAREIDISREAIVRFAREIDDGKYDGKRRAAYARARMYPPRTKYIYWRGYSAGALPEQFYRWELGATREHCKDCSAYNGQVHTMDVWKKHNAFPNSWDLECKGIKCDCRLIPTSGPASGVIRKPGNN